MSQPANDEFSQHLSDDETSNHEEASDTGGYVYMAMEMEHYLEYIDNDVWKVIQNGNSKKRISTGKDDVIRILPPVTAAEIQAVEKERKAKNILLVAIPKEHMRRFHGMDDAKEIWEAIRTRFGGMQIQENAEVPAILALLHILQTNTPEMKLLLYEVIIPSFTNPIRSGTASDDLELIDDLDIGKLDIKWEIAMIAIRI
ncbi:hypothetical protein Tco_0920161 [Tanacetum coccineum]